MCHDSEHLVRFLGYSPDTILKVNVTTAMSKVSSRSHHDAAHLHSLTSVPTNINLLHLIVSDI